MNSLMTVGFVELAIGVAGIVVLGSDDAHLKLFGAIAFIGVFTVYYADWKGKRRNG